MTYTTLAMKHTRVQSDHYELARISFSFPNVAGYDMPSALASDFLTISVPLIGMHSRRNRSSSVYDSQGNLQHSRVLAQSKCPTSFMQ